MGAIRKHFFIGVIAAVLLVLVYLGIITLFQDGKHALEQTAKLWYWILLLAIGFGVQVGLFSFIRRSLKERRATATASVTASGGVSAGSMIACCAHHLSDVLPFLGLAGVAAFLVDYQLFFIVLGVLSNILGITIMLETIQRHNLCPWVGSWRWDMNRVKKGTMISAVLVLALTAFLARGVV